MKSKVNETIPLLSKENTLSPLGEKIFLDRYARKDMTKTTLKKGDTVIVCTDLTTGQREIGVILYRAGNQFAVELRDGTTVERTIEHIDKPLETQPTQMVERVAQALATVESPEKQAKWVENFRWLLTDWKFVPGGRILAGAGTDQNLTYFNCFVVPSPHDSRGGIMTTLTQMTEIMSRGGGVGINISSLRPQYAYVKGVNGRSSGSVSWGGLYSFVTGLVEQAGSRRGALMLILNVWHPDVLEFINSKRVAGQITNANISVGITDDFMAAVKADADWDLVFPDTGEPDYDDCWDGNLVAWRAAGKPIIRHKTVKAREVWQNIIESAWASAEPGLWFMDRANKMSNSGYYPEGYLISTNPCGEQPLAAWSVCNLGALNLSQFIKRDDVDWTNLAKAVRYAVRFLDNVIDNTPYFFDENANQQQAERRVGLGTMGLAELLIRLKIRYGSPESIQFLDKLYHFIAQEAYLASADYALEKGIFAKFDPEKFLQSGFMKAMPEEVRVAVALKGLRNVTLLTQAPTGTTGTMIGTSTGIEPYYFWSYFRKSRLGMHEEKVNVAAEWQEANPNQPLPDYFVTAMDLAPEDHVRVQAAIQRWVDSSISKTCNVPHTYTVDQVRDLYELMYDLGCKGGTIYRDGSRNEQVLHLDDQTDDQTNEADIARPVKAIEQPEPIEPIKQTPLPPEVKARVRPTIMHGKTYRKHTPVGTAYITINANGDGDQAPFEIFINISKVGSDVAADAEGLGRIISLILRMPGPLTPYERAQDVIAQLRGIGSGQQQGFGKQRVMSLSDAVAQALAEHIGFHPNADLPGLPDEEDEDIAFEMNFSTPKGDICPTCGNAALMMIEGCKKCYSCGYSEC